METPLEFSVFEVEITPHLTTVEIAATGVQGVKGDKGDQGDPGPEGPAGPAGADGNFGGLGGLPAGGTTGDVLIKDSPVNYDVSWTSVVGSPVVEFPIDPELLYENSLI